MLKARQSYYKNQRKEELDQNLKIEEIKKQKQKSEIVYSII
jgi:hypothetical protein